MFMVIRTEKPGDHLDTAAVIESAFGRPDEARLVAKLREAGELTISLVAEHEGRIVGHVAFSPIIVDASMHGLGLAPLAVIPEFQRRGIGGRLVLRGVEAAQHAGYDFLVVLGDPHYYGRFGFAAAAAWGLIDDFGGGEAFQVLALRDGGVPRGAGLVRYAPEFQLLG